MVWEVFLGGSAGKEPTCQCRRCKRGFSPWLGKIPWRRKWQPAPVFLPGKSHGERSLVGYSPWDHKESDTTEHVCARVHIHTQTQWDRASVFHPFCPPDYLQEKVLVLRGLQCHSNTHLSLLTEKEQVSACQPLFFRVGNSLWIESVAFICSHCTYSWIYFLISTSVYQLCFR